MSHCSTLLSSLLRNSSQWLTDRTFHSQELWSRRSHTPLPSPQQLQSSIQITQGLQQPICVASERLFQDTRRRGTHADSVHNAQHLSQLPLCSTVSLQHIRMSARKPGLSHKLHFTPCPLKVHFFFKSNTSTEDSNQMLSCCLHLIFCVFALISSCNNNNSNGTFLQCLPLGFTMKNNTHVGNIIQNAQAHMQHIQKHTQCRTAELIQKSKW